MSRETRFPPRKDRASGHEMYKAAVVPALVIVAKWNCARELRNYHRIASLPWQVLASTEAVVVIQASPRSFVW
jgi:hypothetical protein